MGEDGSSWLGLVLPLCALVVAALGAARIALGHYAARIAAQTSFFPSERRFRTSSQSDKTAPFPSLTAPASLSLSIITPAYNEEERLPVMMRETVDYLEDRANKQPGFSWEIIVVDDGSADATAAAGQRYADTYGTDRVRVLRLAKNVGKGGAVRKGMLCARGSLLLMADADAATEIRDMERVEAALAKVQRSDNPLAPGEAVAVGVGSRAHLQDEAVAQRTILRNILMWGFHVLVGVVGGVRGIRDTQCGFKLFTRAAAQLVMPSLHIERWAFDVELLLLAQRLGVPTTEVPVHWTEVPGSKLSVLSATLTMARDMFVIRACYAMGIWRPRSRSEWLQAGE